MWDIVVLGPFGDKVALVRHVIKSFNGRSKGHQCVNGCLERLFEMHHERGYPNRTNSRSNYKWVPGTELSDKCRVVSYHRTKRAALCRAWDISSPVAFNWDWYISHTAIACLHANPIDCQYVQPHVHFSKLTWYRASSSFGPITSVMLTSSAGCGIVVR